MTRRKRDPNRKRVILDAAARLVGERGYAGVTMAEIGREVGIAASAIYWHYPAKQQLLVALFDDCLDRLLREQAQAVEEFGNTHAALLRMTELQVDFVLNEHSFAKVYYQQANHLPAEEQVRLRAKQRAYVEVWVSALTELRADLSQQQVEDLVHATIGAIQSALVHRSRLSAELRRDLLIAAASRIQLD